MEQKMLRRLWIALFVLLTACVGRNPTTSTPVPPTNTVPPTSRPGCTVISPMPTPGPTQRSLFPPVSDADWVRGPDTASITIIEYSDFQ